MSVNYFFAFFAFILFTFDSNGQAFSYQILGGVNVSNFKYSATNNGNRVNHYGDNRTTYFLGFGIEKPLKSSVKYNFLFNTELHYSQQGNSFYSPSIGKQFNVNNQINLVSILKGEVFNNIYIGTGGYAGYLVYIDEYYREDEESHKNFDFGIVGTIEYKFIEKISIEMKYLFGLTDILNREFDNGNITHDKYNRVLQIGLNYTF